MKCYTVRKHRVWRGVDSFPPTLHFITGFTMEAKEGGDSKLVLATFQPAGRKRSSDAGLSGFDLCQ